MELLFMLTGFEIDMLSVGDADCILATGWSSDRQRPARRVLIDGGNKGAFDTVRTFLHNRNVSYLDAVVCTHPHDDHAAGLLELVKDETIGIGAAFAHVPQRHADPVSIEKALKLLAGSAEADSIRKSLDTAKNLVLAFAKRGLSVVEPFAGMDIEFLTVVGPSQKFYAELVSQFSDAERVKKIDAKQLSLDVWGALHDHALKTVDTGLPPDPETTPENNSSVILAILYGENKYIFTADAGVPALQQASERYNLANCHWMQIPHHGSRRNLSPALAKYFSPKFAWASADGNKKHPRRAVVNLFKQLGTIVNSTHYPTPANMWKFEGTVPSRTGYKPLVSLYDAPAPTKLPPPPSALWRSALLSSK
jgi:beta-lactamase superfamily II metal-dependent hydrolase